MSKTIYSSYSKSANSTWCRTVTCNGQGCNEVIDECVTPEQVEETFNPLSKQCTKEYYYQDEKIGEETTNAETEIEYNSTIKQCKKIYVCSSVAKFDELQSPFFGN